MGVWIVSGNRNTLAARFALQKTIMCAGSAPSFGCNGLVAPCEA